MEARVELQSFAIQFGGATLGRAGSGGRLAARAGARTGAPPLVVVGLRALEGGGHFYGGPGERARRPLHLNMRINLN